VTAPLPRLRSTTVALPEPPDLVTRAGAGTWLFRAEDSGLLGWGEAARIDLPDGLSDPEALAAVAAGLAGIESEDPVGLPGSGPVAIGALPFDPAEPGHLTVPRRVWGRHGDRGWLTTVEPIGPAAGEAGRAPTPPPAEPPAEPPAGPPVAAGAPPDRFSLASTMTQAEWMDLVAATVELLARGDLDKVVLARRVDIEANRPFVVADVLERLCALYPSCMIFSVEGFIGASPELLIRRRGDEVLSHPLAGTVARSGDAHGDEALVARLLSSDKTRREHRIVVDAIAAALGPSCLELDVPAEPEVLGLRNVSHLATRIRGRLRHAPSALELVARIHPTPAVAGTPTEAAVRYLQKAEGFDRGCYAGPVGWVDAAGDGCFALGIRSARLDGAKASIFAGNGIVSGSDPAAELAETQLKLQALLAALVRP
jgi:menaquinone-specific isochorismate synthase